MTSVSSEPEGTVLMVKVEPGDVMTVIDGDEREVAVFKGFYWGEEKRAFMESEGNLYAL